MTELYIRGALPGMDPLTGTRCRSHALLTTGAVLWLHGRYAHPVHTSDPCTPAQRFITATGATTVLRLCTANQLELPRAFMARKSQDATSSTRSYRRRRTRSRVPRRYPNARACMHEQFKSHGVCAYVVDSTVTVRAGVRVPPHHRPDTGGTFRTPSPGVATSVRIRRCNHAYVPAPNSQSCLRASTQHPAPNYLQLHLHLHLPLQDPSTASSHPQSTPQRSVAPRPQSTQHTAALSKTFSPAMLFTH